MTERLSLSDSSCASRYVTLCFLKAHLNFWMVVGMNVPSLLLVRTLSSKYWISSKTCWHSSVMCFAACLHSSVAMESGICNVCPTDLSIKENRVMFLEMLCISRPADAISLPIAFITSDKRKPAPATPMIDAMIPVTRMRSALRWEQN